MKKSIGIVCAFALLLASVSSVPVSKNQHDEDDIVMIPFGHPDDFGFEDGVVDTGYPSAFFPLSSSFFGGFMKSIEDTINNLRNRMSDTVGKFPPENGSWTGLIPEGKGNTTSTVKVVNGLKITVNETTYVDENDDSGNVVKVKIVDIHPASEESDSDESKETPKEKEETTPKNAKEENGSPEVYEPKINEISKENREDNEIKINSLDDDANLEIFEIDNPNEFPPGEPTQEVRAPLNYQLGNEIDIIMPVKEIETNDVNIDEPEHDMSKDITINDKLSNRFGFQDPDSEIIQNAGYFQPFDLSDDVLVNQMLADAGTTYNTDAEILTASDNVINPFFQRLKEENPEIIVTK